MLHNPETMATAAVKEKSKSFLEGIICSKAEYDHDVSAELLGSDPSTKHKILTNKTFYENEKDSIQQMQLVKLTIPKQEDIKDIFEQYAQQQSPGSTKWCVWISKRLTVDLNLPLPIRSGIVQVFFIGVDCPAVILTLHEKHASKEDVEEYAHRSADTLKWEILGFCHLDFLLLTCIQVEDFTLESLTESINDELADIGRYFGGRKRLDEAMFKTLLKATIAMAGCTSVPLRTSHKTSEIPKVKDGNEDILYLMERAWRDKLSEYTEKLDKTRRLDLGPDADVKDVWAAIETFKRFSTRDYWNQMGEDGAKVQTYAEEGAKRQIIIYTDSPDVHEYFEQLNQEISSEGKIKLTICRNQRYTQSADNTDTVHQLMQHGASVNEKSEQGETALHKAAMEKGRSSDSPRQQRKSLPLLEKEKDSCDKCKQHARRGSFTILLEGTMEDLLKKKPALQEFFKAINALLNSSGGEVIIHLDHDDPDGSTRIALFDQKVDTKMLTLLPGNYLYHDVYERYFIDYHHLLYRVKPISGPRPYSTLKFNSRLPLNSGLVEPSHDQMEAFIQNIHKEPKTPRESIVLSKLRQHQQPLIITKRTTLESSRSSMQSMESAVDVLEIGFHESLSVQAKDIPKQGNRIERCWEISKPYISAFSKLPNGGCVFLGIREDTTVHSKTPKWTEVADDSQVTEFNIKFPGGANKGYKIWKEECKDDDPAYYIMKEDQVPKDEKKSGKHVVQGIEEDEAAQIEANIKSKVTRDLKWVGVTEPKDVVTVERLPVEGTTLQVIQVNIGFYKGICFDDTKGPETYRAVVIAGKKEIQPVPFRDWLGKYEASSLTEFKG